MSASPPPSPQPPRLGLWQVIQSVLASFFGVQSRRNRERDFTQGRAVHFIVVGLIATAVVVLTVWGLVRIILSRVPAG